MTTATATPPTRLVLVAARAPADPSQGAPAVRRYRLARVRTDDRASVAARHEHHRRCDD